MDMGPEYEVILRDAGCYGIILAGGRARRVSRARNLQP